MDYFDYHLMNLRRRGLALPNVPGLVRLDRATLYIRQNLQSAIRELEQRTTKSLGEASYYRIAHLAREAMSLFAMGGDAALADLVVRPLRRLSARTPRLQAIQVIRDVNEALASYESVAVEVDDDGFSESLDFDDEPGGKPKKGKRQLNTADEKSVFVIMPFAPAFADVWKGGIEAATKQLGLRPIRVDMISRSTNITDDIVDSIDKSHLIIADVSGNNPNVMFELGFALAKTKPNVIIGQSANDLPFDIRNIRTIIYANTWSGIEELRDKLKEFLAESVPAATRGTPSRAPRAKKRQTS